MYGLSVAELLKSDFGYSKITRRELDIKPPHDLLVALARRSGLSVERLEEMTLWGVAPFLFGSQCSELENDEIEASTVLFEASSFSSYEQLTQWIRREPLSTMICCRECLVDYPDSSASLGWLLGVVFSCPIHKVMLEPGRHDGKRIKWVKDRAEEAPELVCRLDRRSMMALVEGFVQLPGGMVSAAQWFRLVQTIFHELNAPLLSVEMERFKWQLKLWNLAEYYPSGPFERFRFDNSCSLLISTAIDLMEKGKVIPKGMNGPVFSAHTWADKNDGTCAVFF